jgi:hypothetical protein
MQNEVLDRRANRSPPKDDLASLELPGAVGPKMQVNVPKHLVLYQLSKHFDAAQLEESLSFA